MNVFEHKRFQSYKYGKSTIKHSVGVYTDRRKGNMQYNLICMYVGMKHERFKYILETEETGSR